MYKCKFCSVCNGKACINEMPGMGGVKNNENFILNCAGWKKYYTSKKIDDVKIRLAPMTGAVENIGYSDEKKFYFDILSSCSKENIFLSIGDGTPDEKLLWGLEALKKLNKKAAVFIKPYPDNKFYERLEWALPYADYIGIDIDAFNILTMRHLVNLEKKSAVQLNKLKSFLNTKGLPLVIKGIFTDEDLQMLCEVKPDVAFVSNHGGRIETTCGSTADYLFNHKDYLKKYCKKIWVDGGIRNKDDINAAITLGADEVLIGRPFASALCKDSLNGIKNFLSTLK